MKKIIRITEETIKEILKKLGLSPQIGITEDKDIIKIKILGDELGILIGYHGETLRALELLTKLIVAKKTDSWQRILLDIGDYRQRREQSLKLLASQMAERVKFIKEPLNFSPMSAFERRIIHLTLQEDPKIATESIGEGKERRVVIRLK